MKHTDLSARDVAVEALTIAGEICIYSNQNIVVEELE
jgi:ATP-dependent HslUV protease subunit HslV